MTREELDALWFQAMRQSIEAGEDFIRYHFAALVAAAEREACAMVAEEKTNAWTEYDYNSACMDCAKAIRARGGE